MVKIPTEEIGCREAFFVMKNPFRDVMESRIEFTFAKYWECLKSE
ncbi:hypothetical protein LptCag_0416 [Leptospirillum ferriphilum]|uniref:Uncharacterized protein n=1 Tax=Leptospirillum ferriphilum TaxID=178606 RepID=A0A094WA29_9BACT|nr:hypothetical protein LptCag_0416 [Leptospirillum ferriphilum]